MWSGGLASAGTVPLGVDLPWTDEVGAYASIATVALLVVAGAIAYWQARETRSLPPTFSTNRSRFAPPG
jgi:hypothetical protein